MITRPYRRIIRPFNKNESPPDFDYFGNYRNGFFYTKSHLFDDDYAPNRVSLIQAYHVIQRDLVRLFEYVEPSEENCSTYSHRLYELLLRASTEFEANCKGILEANGYAASGYWNIQDYSKINDSSRLSEYELQVGIWHGPDKILRPFAEWATGQRLTWYQEYNAVKHNRSARFPAANLENVLLAVSGVLAILYSQFYILSFRPDASIDTITEDDDNGYVSQEDCIFRIRPPQIWTEEEYYDFDWTVLRDQPNKFQNCSF